MLHGRLVGVPSTTTATYSLQPSLRQVAVVQPPHCLLDPVPVMNGTQVYSYSADLFFMAREATKKIIIKKMLILLIVLLSAGYCLKIFRKQLLVQQCEALCRHSQHLQQILHSVASSPVHIKVSSSIIFFLSLGHLCLEGLHTLVVVLLCGLCVVGLHSVALVGF